MDVERDDVLVGVLPLFHGMTVLMMYSLMRQAELVLLAKFEPQPFLEALKQRVTVGFRCRPSSSSSQSTLVQQYDLSALRYIFSGAAPLDGATQQTLSEQLGIPLHQGWGMTELSPIGTVSPYDKPTVNGSAGALVGSTEGMIVDPETGASLPPGAEGELLIRGPQVMKGYLGRADATAETIRPDGFLRTGDLAYHDDAGNVFLVDRLKELIKVKALQVAPAEIEGGCSRLRSCRRRRHRDPRRACGAAAQSVLREEARCGHQRGGGARASPRRSRRTSPAQIEFIDAIPKSASGKSSAGTSWPNRPRRLHDPRASHPSSHACAILVSSAAADGGAPGNRLPALHTTMSARRRMRGSATCRVGSQKRPPRRLALPRMLLFKAEASRPDESPHLRQAAPVRQGRGPSGSPVSSAS